MIPLVFPDFPKAEDAAKHHQVSTYAAKVKLMPLIVTWTCRTLNEIPNACKKIFSEIKDRYLPGGSFFGCR